jgi:hypothetical protein
MAISESPIEISNSVAQRIDLSLLLCLFVCFFPILSQHDQLSTLIKLRVQFPVRAIFTTAAALRTSNPLIKGYGSLSGGGGGGGGASVIKNMDNCPFTISSLTREKRGLGLRPLDCWGCGFESHSRYGCLSLVNVVCCEVEFSASGRSLVQRSPIECVCHWVWSGATVTLYTYSE